MFLPKLQAFLFMCLFLSFLSLLLALGENTPVYSVFYAVSAVFHPAARQLCGQC